MVWSYHLIHSRDVSVPGIAFLFDECLSLCRQVVKASPRPASAFDPAAFDETLFFEPAEHGIQRTDAEAQSPAGSFFNQFSDFVTVPVVFFEERQNQQVRTTFFEFTIEHRAPTILLNSIMSS